MNNDGLHNTVIAFVKAASTLTTVARGGYGAVTATPPYAVVTVVSDVEVTPTDSVVNTPATGALSYVQQRRARIQVDVIGGPSAENLCQQLAMLWRSNHPAAQAAVTAGLAPERATDVRNTTKLRGGSGDVRSAAVDLTGYHLLAVTTTDADGLLVDTIDADVTGVGEDDAPNVTGVVVAPWAYPP